MPLKKIKKQLGDKWPWVENGFWVLVFIIAYAAMQKVMHPGSKIFGLF